MTASSKASSHEMQTAEPDMNYAMSIIATPLQAGQLRNCPHCSESLSQQYVRKDRSDKFGEVRVYRCSKSGKEVDYLVKLPLHFV
jgi:hypothetical protein